jgi:inner membrane protein
MASIVSHPAVPLAIAVALGSSQVSPRLALTACVASALPDIDVLGFAAGVPYGHVLGHRGFTHSVLFALLLAVAAAVLAKPLRAAPAVTAAIVFVAAVSHGLLDACTTGGLGVAFFAPFSNHRYFLPWPVIQVSPIGVAPFFSERGVSVLASELRWIWLPSTLAAGLGFVIRKVAAGVRTEPRPARRGL